MQVCVLIGGGNFEKGLSIVRGSAEINKPFIPHQFREEMQGMADGLKAIGSSLTFEDIVLHAVSDDIFMMDPKGKNFDKPSVATGYPPTRCTSFSAWGNATKSGSLIFGANEDYFDDEEVLKNRPAVVIDPTDGGYGYTGGIWNLWHGGGGMNEAGIAIKAHLSFANDETLRGVLSDMLLRMVLQYSDSIEDAVDIIASHPRTCGIMIHVADAKTNRAVVIEYTANNIAVRLPENGGEVLWNTNHFNTYPGWQSYQGPNMVQYNKDRNNLEDISTLEKWQESLAKVGQGAKGRYGRLQQLLNEHSGELTIEKAKLIMGDRYDLVKNRLLGKTEPNTEKGLSRTISSFSPDWVMAQDIEFYKSGEKGNLAVKAGSVWSFVASPSTSEIWWAIGTLPPVHHTGEFRYLNLKKELERNR
jgi:hypothetical protein